MCPGRGYIKPRALFYFFLCFLASLKGQPSYIIPPCQLNLSPQQRNQWNWDQIWKHHTKQTPISLSHVYLVFCYRTEGSCMSEESKVCRVRGASGIWTLLQFLSYFQGAVPWTFPGEHDRWDMGLEKGLQVLQGSRQWGPGRYSGMSQHLSVLGRGSCVWSENVHHWFIWH